MKKWIGILFMSFTLSTTNHANDTLYPHVISKQGSSFPITELTLMVPSGSASLDKKGGESALLEDILSYSSLAHIIENYGGQYSVNFTKDSFSLQVTLLTKEFSAFIKDWEKALPSFKIQEKDLELSKRRLLEEIQHLQGNPDKRSDLLFAQKIFANHPYAKNALSYTNTIPNITLEDVDNLWHSLLLKKNTYMISSSNKPKEIESILSSFWESLPNTNVLLPSLNDVTLPSGAMSWEEKDPQLSQSFVHVALLLPHISLQDKPYLLLLADIIGGSFNSRLFTILRAKYGLSYSPHAYFQSQLKSDILDIAYSTKSSSTKESLSIVHDILKDLENNGVTQKELDTSKKLIYNKLLRLEENNASLNRLVVNDILNQNSEGSIKILEQGIRDCTLEKLNPFIQRLFSTYPKLQFILEGS